MPIKKKPCQVRLSSPYEIWDLGISLVMLSDSSSFPVIGMGLLCLKASPFLSYLWPPFPLWHKTLFAQIFSLLMKPDCWKYKRHEQWVIQWIPSNDWGLVCEKVGTAAGLKNAALSSGNEPENTVRIVFIRMWSIYYKCPDKWNFTL